MDRLISEAVNAAKARAGEAQAVNDKNAARAGFEGSPLGEGVTDKFVRDEVEARKDAIVAAAVEVAIKQFKRGAVLAQA